MLREQILFTERTIALALPSYDRQRLSGIRRGWCPSRSVRIYVREELKGCSVPTLATLTACREVGVFYNPWVAKSSETTTQETLMAAMDLEISRESLRAEIGSNSPPLDILAVGRFSPYFTRVNISEHNSRVPVQSEPPS